MTSQFPNPHMKPEAYRYLWPTINDLEKELITHPMDLTISFDNTRDMFTVRNALTNELYGRGKILFIALEDAYHHLLYKRQRDNCPWSQEMGRCDDSEVLPSNI
jgi:hypothetical protein